MGHIFTRTRQEAENHEFSARDWTGEALDAAELDYMTQITAQRELCRQGNVEAIVAGLGAVDAYADYRQLRELTQAMAELSARMNSRITSAEMASYCDDIDGALGWAESMVKGDCTPLNYGGTED